MGLKVKCWIFSGFETNGSELWTVINPTDRYFKVTVTVSNNNNKRKLLQDDVVVKIEIKSYQIGSWVRSSIEIWERENQEKEKDGGKKAVKKKEIFF